jgi:hypothetical protein
MAFPNEDTGHDKKDGLDIEYDDTLLRDSYANSPYNYNMLDINSYPETDRFDARWQINNENSQPQLIFDWKLFSGTSTFPNQNKTQNGKDGLDITEVNAKKKASYEDSPYNYVFGIDEWKIIENSSYPYLYGEIEPSDGNLKYWDGTEWKTGNLKYWDGSAWVTHTLKRWDGSAWS